jgi:hypothetical protein
VPFLTNSLPLEEGEELILEVAEKMRKEATPAKRSWLDAMKDDEKKTSIKNKQAQSDGVRIA